MNRLNQGFLWRPSWPCSGVGQPSGLGYPFLVSLRDVYEKGGDGLILEEVFVKNEKV